MKYQVSDDKVIDFDNIDCKALKCLELFRKINSDGIRAGEVLGHMEGVLHIRWHFDSNRLLKQLNNRKI